MAVTYVGYRGKSLLSKDAASAVADGAETSASTYGFLLQREPAGAGGRLAAPRLVIAPEGRGPAVSSWRDSLFRSTLLAADLLAIACAFELTIRMAPGSLQLTWMSAACLAIMLIGAKLIGLYDRDEALIRKTTLDEAPKLFQLATLCTLIALLANSLVAGAAVKPYGIVVLWSATTLLMIVARTCARAIALAATPSERCLFIGDAEEAKTIHCKLTEGGGIKATVVSHLYIHESAPLSSDGLSRRKLDEIHSLIQEFDVHRVIVAPHSADAGDTLDLMRTLKAVGVRVSVLPRLLEVVGSSVEFDDLHGVTVMGVRRFDLTRSSALVKRAFDLIGASFGLLALAPFAIAVAVAIKLCDGGPVFFRQQRVGRHGKRFRVFKFRTMVPHADALKDGLRDRNEAREGLFKIADDPRVTKIGRLLRSSSLDELPQLINVLRGEMSLVGPRPLIIEEDEQIEGWDRRRLELMPGMTGHWQILGPARVPLREMVAIDYLYVANWSLWTDIKILLRTVPHVLARRGL